MEARELRIGNYVQYYGDVAVVVEIKRGEDVGFEFINDDVIAIRKLTENHSPKPIPLNEDWLLRFEEDLRKSGYEFKRTSTGRYDIWIGASYITTISYVHEYQNLFFALQSSELTIKETVSN